MSEPTFASQEEAISALMSAGKESDWTSCDQAITYLLTQHLGVGDVEAYTPSREEEADELLSLYLEAGLDKAPEGTVTHRVHRRLKAHMLDRDDEVNEAFNDILDL
ncbi:MAG: hypothetical protein D6E12_16675 [Desulfovibrio sp.]|nr:MAG: hypothetical protein D6E12_16675 [Desulfovibrio sp.]